MNEMLKGMALVLEQVAKWRGFRGSVVFVVHVDVAKNSFKFKPIIYPDASMMVKPSP